MPGALVEREKQSALKTGLAELDSDLEEGLVTEKGYWKKKLRLLQELMTSDDISLVEQLESDVKDDVITEKGYFIKVGKILNKVVTVLSNDTPIGSGDAVQENAKEAKTKKDMQDNVEKDVNEKAKEVPNGNAVNVANGKTKKAENPEVKMETEAVEDAKEVSDSPPPKPVKDVEKDAIGNAQKSEEKMETEVVKDSKDASDSPPPKPSGSRKKKDSVNKEKEETPCRKGRSAKKAAAGQPSIAAMFAKKQAEPKRKVETGTGDEDGSTEKQPEKRIKLEPEAKETDDNVTEPVKKPAMKKGRNRCLQCRQYYDDPDLKVYDPAKDANALEEIIMLCDDRLQLCTGQEKTFTDDRPQHRLTGFSIYDTMNHLCPFDSGLIEQNKNIFFSGYVKPIYDENPDIEGGIRTRQMGPINEWWTSGFDGGDQALIGFSTAVADYILMEPSTEYKPIISAVLEKIYMSKLVIEFLNDYPDSTYEDLLNSLCSSTPPKGLAKYTEESLLRHAQWIVDQVESYDESADEDEQMLIVTACMRDLIKLAGVTLGQRRKDVKGIKVKKLKKDIPTFTMATTTPLVKGIFDSLFKGQIDEKFAPVVKRKRCGTCERCQAPDCGKCSHCQDMIKFGGSGRMKQACVGRRCTNMAVADAEADDILDDMRELEIKAPAVKPRENKHSFKKLKHTMAWVGTKLSSKAGKSYYYTVDIGGVKISIGDYVSVKPDDPTVPVYLGRAQYLYEEDKTKEKCVHVHWFKRGNDTLLGETSDPQELFVVDECESTLLAFVIGKIRVEHKKIPKDWSMQGGHENPDADRVIPEDDENAFFYQFCYDEERGRFEDVVAEADTGLRHCPSCSHKASKELAETPVMEEKLTTDSGHVYYGALKFDNKEYHLGDCIYIDPGTVEIRIKPNAPPKKIKTNKAVDEEIYPEKYRKTDYVKGNNDESPDPFQVCRIVKLYTKRGLTPSETKHVKIVVGMFYRTEDTHLNKSEAFKSPLNLLYWSEEEATISLSDVIGPCSVTFTEDTESDVLTGHMKNYGDTFYFGKAYDAEKREFVDVPQYVSKPNRKKSKVGEDVAPWRPTTVVKDETPLAKLRCLDVFAGCGGLSEGFHQAGIAESSWAIEKEEPAALAYKLNNPSAEVFTDDCNNLLLSVMQGKKHNASGQLLPQKGEVDLLCGGPPCQGFSGMNRFNHREYSKFKNSLISSYLSYCDYYRPRFFLLENVRNFVSFKRGVVLKLALRCLVRMGYQCTFGVLQAGCYGVPQTRRRAIILAAAPGEKLPDYPEPLHTFSPRGIQLTVQIDDLRFEGCVKNTHSAPFRTITVRDALSDLPKVNNGANTIERKYTQTPQSTFQGLMRNKELSKKEESKKEKCKQQDSNQEKKEEIVMLRDHICKDMNPLVHVRMSHIPLDPGSDWRDLPNIVCKLSDGTSCKKLIYGHHDKKNGRSSTGALRGVCQCVQGKGCDASDRQHSTLIPWCLPHTGNRHNNWAGLYGRLQWDGFFSTTITNPEPMGKQGRVLHPEQHRVVSVRECARSQGFPDHYLFYGSVLDKHRQVGNAVPPPMAREIGRELKKCIKWRAALVAEQKEVEKQAREEAEKQVMEEEEEQEEEEEEEAENEEEEAENEEEEAENEEEEAKNEESEAENEEEKEDDSDTEEKGEEEVEEATEDKQEEPMES